ncbi:MAG: regulatory protein RecX [Limnochordales bacterium]
MEDRLRRAGFSDPVIEETVNWCRRLGYVDDERFARSWVEYRLLHSPSGRRRLEAELRQKGVDAPVVERVLADMLPPELEERLCREEAARRARRLAGQPDDVRRRRLAAFLARRGFSPETVYAALAQVDTPPDTD